MLTTKTYPTKSNTICRDEEYANMGLNPVMELNYGKLLTRGMIYFDHNKVKKLVDDKTYPDISKVKHRLKMFNTASLFDVNDGRPCVDSTLRNDKIRTGSFDLIFFKIPYPWDGGKGFDFVQDLYGRGERAFSTDGSTWKKYGNYFKWDEDGIYSSDRLSRELDLFTSKDGNKSKVIFAFQHFDFGNEDIDIDITELFNKYVSGEECNNGFGIAFVPQLEEICNRETSSYVGFFTGHTNSYFEPYIETTYDEKLEDDRANFYLNKKNKLYFYASIAGEYVNLDKLPKCTINDVEYEVKQATKGIYYVEVQFNSGEHQANVMYYDEWTDIYHNGVEVVPSVIMDFVTKDSSKYYSFGLPSANNKVDEEFVPSIYGINHKEKILRGDIRKVNVECHIKYTSNQLRNADGIEYRIFVRDYDKELNAIPWTSVNRGYNENFFLIDTEDFIPHRYHIDIRVKRNLELTYYRNMIEFDIISEFDKSNK